MYCICNSLAAKTVYIHLHGPLSLSQQAVQPCFCSLSIKRKGFHSNSICVAVHALIMIIDIAMTSWSSWSWFSIMQRRPQSPCIVCIGMHVLYMYLYVKENGYTHIATSSSVTHISTKSDIADSKERVARLRCTLLSPSANHLRRVYSIEADGSIR